MAQPAGCRTAPSLSCPRQGPGLGVLGTTIVPEARLPFVGCGERRGALQSFSLGESREKGPGAGCAMMEGMGKGYSSERPHLLGDSCLPDRHLLGDPSSSRGPCLELEAAVRKLLSEEVAASSSRQGPQLLPSVALV